MLALVLVYEYYLPVQVGGSMALETGFVGTALCYVP